VNCDWIKLLGRRVLVRIKPEVVLPYDRDEFSHIYEVRVAEVSPSGKYVKFTGDINGWEPAIKWEIVEVLDQ